MMSYKMGRLLDPSTGLMECKACGRRWCANLKHGGHYIRGSWQCPEGCTEEDVVAVEIKLGLRGPGGLWLMRPGCRKPPVLEGGGE